MVDDELGGERQRLNLLEELTKMHYDQYVADVQDIEPYWGWLPPSHQDRMKEAMAAAVGVLIHRGLLTADALELLKEEK